MQTITHQDLKDNKALIIQYFNDSAKLVELKRLMQYMLDLVNNDMAEIKDDETFEDFIYECYWQLAPRSRKVSKAAEMLGKLEADGKIERFDLNSYYANKYTK